MKIKYKGCEIEVVREDSLGGDTLIYYGIYDDGFEVAAGFSIGEDELKDFANGLKIVVDDYKENPEDYE